MFSLDGHIVTLTIILKLLSLAISVGYFPFVVNKTTKGGTFNTFVLVTWSLSVAVFVTLQWLM